jgi:DNA excision repair protein ERCC-4
MMADDNEKASTSGGSSDPSFDVESPAAATDSGDKMASPASAAATGKGKKKWIIGFIVVGALLIFAVVFPTVYLTMTRRNDNNPSSTSNIEESEPEPDNGSTPDGGNGNGTRNRTTVFGGPFNATSNLRLFTEDVLSGYKDSDELKSDVAHAAWFLVEQVVQRNNRVDGYGSIGTGQRPSDGNLESGGPEPASPVTSDSGQGSNHGSGSDFGTNNQEALEEGDMVVSDGTYVYAAYSDYLLAWNARDGTQVAQIQMPPLDLGSAGGFAEGGDGGPAQDIYWYPKPEIRNLLLYQGRLLVIVGGYGPALMLEAGLNETVLNDFLNTQLRFYDVNSVVTGNNQPYSVLNLQGSFNSVRMLDGNAHVMTTTGINTYNDLVMPFEKDGQPDLSAMGPEEYTQAVYTKAQQEAVPKFVEKLTRQIAIGSAGAPNLVKISLFQNEYSGAGIEGLTFPDGILSTLALVNSFSLTGDLSTPVVATSSGAFLPSYWAHFYGSTTHLIIAGQGQRVDAQSGYSVESTNFLSFAVDGAAATAEAIGSTDGYVLNSYAIDVLDEYLRVGVSINNQWFFVTEPMPLMEGDVVEGSDTTGDVATDPTTGTSSVPAQNTNSTTENYIVILTLPGLNGTEAGVMQEVGRLQLGKPNELFTALRFYDNVAYAVTFERKDPLYVLDLSNPAAPRIDGELTVPGFSSYLHALNPEMSVMLGVGQAADANGTVTGTKLSVYNVKNRTNPFVAAEYVMENTADTFTYTAAESDPKTLRVVPGMNLISLPIDRSNYVSGSRWNGFFTFFVNETHIIKECEIGHAVNTSVYYGEPMPAEGDGGAGGVSDPSTGGGGGSDGSAPTATDAMPCFYCAALAPRSMVFDGNLMTMNNHFVRSNSLSTCGQVWALDIVVPVDNATMTYGGCCGAYW